MAKEIGNLAIVVSANTALLDAGLANAQTSVQKFGDGVNASVSRMSQSFAPTIVKSTGLIASEHRRISKELQETANQHAAMTASIGANFGKSSNAAGGFAGKIRESTASIGSAFASVRQAAGQMGAAVGISVAVVAALQKTFRDATADANQFIQSLDLTNAAASTAAISARIKEIQERLGASESSMVGSAMNALMGNSAGKLKEELGILQAQEDILAMRRDREQSVIENTAALAQHEKDVKAYADAQRKKAEIHKQLVDQINSLSIENAADPLTKLRNERDIEMAKIWDQFKGKVDDEAFGQLERGVTEKFRRAFDELANRGSDISDMFEEEVEDGAKAGLGKAMAENKFSDLIRSGSTAAQTLAGRTSQSSIASTLNKQLEMQKATSRDIKTLVANTASLATLEEVDM